MSSCLRWLGISAIGLVAVFGLSACHPAYVHESYQEGYLYRPMPVYSPSYSVQYYSTTPAYVERRTIVVPQVVVAPRRTGHVDEHRPDPGPGFQGRSGNDARDREASNRFAGHSGRGGAGPGAGQASLQQRHMEPHPPVTARPPEGRPNREEHPNRKGWRDKDR